MPSRYMKNTSTWNIENVNEMIKGPEQLFPGFSSENNSCQEDRSWFSWSWLSSPLEN
jgi:hypothetical protein